MTAIEIGHNVRHWITYELPDLAGTDAAILAPYVGENGLDLNGEALALLRRLDDHGQLTVTHEAYDGEATPFDTESEPVVIEYEPDGVDG